MNKPIINTHKNRIEFLDVRYYLHDSGIWIPSTTTILDAYPKTAQFYEWLKKYGDQADEIRDEAGEIGTIVHNLTELYDNGEVVSLVDSQNKVKYKQIAWSMFERYVEFSRRYMPDIVQNEMHIIDPDLGFGGTIDRIMEFDTRHDVVGGKRLLIDIKTSGSVHKHYWLQLVAYKKLYEKKTGEVLDGVAILWLNAKTRSEGRKGAIQGLGWQMCFPDQPLDHYWDLFLHVQALWMEENKDYKPRNISYSLTHSKLKSWD